MSESKTGEPWAFYVFDLIDHDGTYAERRDSLIVKWDHLDYVPHAERIEVVATAIAANEAELERMESLMVEQGHEGVILRTLGAPYKHGRSTPSGPLLKLKRFVDFEAEVIGVYEE